MEHPKLSMARWLREMYEATDDAPEDVCAYQWHWAAAREQFIDVQVGNIAGIEWRVRIEAGPMLQLGDIRYNARFGLDTEHRVAVLFWGTGGPTPDIRPSLIDQLALEGMAIQCRRRPPQNRLKGTRPKKWVDPDRGPDLDGDEWKRN